MKKRKKGGGGFFSNVSCEETFLNNSNPTAHVHCKILSIRTNQTHLHLPSFFQRISFLKYPPFEISRTALPSKEKREREKKKKKVTNSLLTFSSFSLQGS